jgi:hypothetical protein
MRRGEIVMHDHKKLLEMLKDLSPNTNVQELLIYLSELVPDQEGPEQPSDQEQDQ